jgi:hypothetical protein
LQESTSLSSAAHFEKLGINSSFRIVVVESRFMDIIRADTFRTPGGPTRLVGRRGVTATRMSRSSPIIPSTMHTTSFISFLASSVRKKSFKTPGRRAALGDISNGRKAFGDITNSTKKPMGSTQKRGLQSARKGPGGSFSLAAKSAKKPVPVREYEEVEYGYKTGCVTCDCRRRKTLLPPLDLALRYPRVGDSAYELPRV